MTVPELAYSYFKYNVQGTNGQPRQVVLNSLPTEPIKVSFAEGYNRLELKYTPNTSLIYYEIRITKITDDFGIGVGTKWYHNGPNIAGSAEQSVTLNVTSSYFPVNPDGGYRIGLYGKASDSDGYWDVTYLYLTTEENGEHKIYAPSGNDGLTVLTNEPIPNESTTPTYG